MHNYRANKICMLMLLKFLQCISQFISIFLSIPQSKMEISTKIPCLPSGDLIGGKLTTHQGYNREFSFRLKAMTTLQ